jgi:hypothetical protein
VRPPLQCVRDVRVRQGIELYHNGSLRWREGG